MSVDFRFQGTDGVRRPVKSSSEPDLAGLSPQDVFIKKGYITEQFMELYAFCRVKQLINNGAMKPGETFVIGWDPRDPVGLFTNAAVLGLRKGGANVAIAGIIPTPGVSVYLRYLGAAGGMVITASHNPASYNGIKIFTRRGLKLLPGDDLELSRLILNTDYADVKKLDPTGASWDATLEAREIFTRFSLDPVNSLLDDHTPLGNITMILDSANGAMSGVAEKVLIDAGFGEVISLNNWLDGSVNVNSGVADLDGVHEIAAETINPDGRFAKHKAVVTLFEKGRAMADQIKSGEKFVCAAVFDGDGDRFFRVDYDPFTDSAIVLSGDETAVLQAERLAIAMPGKLFVNTVESDLCAAMRGAELGFTMKLAAVGDKWILLAAALASLQQTVAPGAWEEIERLAGMENPSIDAIEKIIDAQNANLVYAPESRFAIGAEESGHSITPAIVETPRGEITVFAGNGLKSCLNTFGAVSTWELSPEARFARLRRPFDSGFKKTLYVYYVDKSRWVRDSEVWRLAKDVLTQAATKIFDGMTVEEMILPEDRDMFYLKLLKDGAHICSAFIRNSGTEDKTGISLRGPMGENDNLMKMGGEAMRLLLEEMKDENSRWARAEKELLRMSAENGAPEQPISGFDETEYHQLLVEVGVKQGLLTSGAPGAKPTELGEWYMAF